MTEEREYYFVFAESEGGLRWYDFFTREGFRHVMVVMQCGMDVMLYDPRERGCNVSKYFCKEGGAVDAAMVADSFARSGHNVVRYTNKDRQVVYGFGTIIPSCVSFCKILTGCNVFGFTPYQFYKNLKKSGFEEI